MAQATHKGGHHPADRVCEVRFYNGVISGYDTGVRYQVTFLAQYLPSGRMNYRVRIEGGGSEWTEHNRRWLRTWYPQVIADVTGGK